MLPAFLFIVGVVVGVVAWTVCGRFGGEGGVTGKVGWFLIGRKEGVSVGVVGFGGKWGWVLNHGLV